MDVDTEAMCCCEVATDDPMTRAYHFRDPQARPEVVARRVVRELPFSEGKLGGHVWDGGVLMAAWATTPAAGRGLAAGGLEFFEGHRVLELGAGLGLVGIALAGAASDCSVVLTDFGTEGTLPEDPDRLIPSGLLQMTRQNVADNGLGNAVVRHLDWHSFLPGPGKVPAIPEERFERVVAADVVYYSSDLCALVAATVVHLVPGGRAFFLVPERNWTGPLVSERATADDLIAELSRFGEVTAIALLGHYGTVEGQLVRLVAFVLRQGKTPPTTSSTC